MTQDLKRSWIVMKAWQKFNDGGEKPLIRYDVGFGIPGIFMSGSMTEQFVGGARVSIIPLSTGWEFIIDNTTDQNSYHGHMGNSVPRSPGTTTPEGTIYQRFFWFQSY